MNKRYYVIALFISLILLVSACKQSGAAAGSAPRTPFIGGTAGVTINFLKDNPPPEVTDSDTFDFNAIVSLKNEGEFNILSSQIKVDLIGFDPADFNIQEVARVLNQNPDDNIGLNGRRRDAEGSTIEGETIYVTFPKGNNAFFKAKQFSGNTEFTFRANVCYAYQTKAVGKLCILRDMINVRDNSICKPTGSRTIYSSSAPVQVTNFRQSVIGQNKLSFSFDISLSGNVEIFRDNVDTNPSSGGGIDAACPRIPSQRRPVENKVKVEVKHVPPSDPIITNIKCGGLDLVGTERSAIGVVTLINNKRTLTCTAELAQTRTELEKNLEITLSYNVLDNNEKKVLVKHLADVSATGISIPSGDI
ncbi:hypothetical protein HYX00_01810 [Candidatus Woesearchaeota archaeon]|nr:hypothetical protein [Candidatus Woesearchaeota archaeon]